MVGGSSISAAVHVLGAPGFAGVATALADEGFLVRGPFGVGRFFELGVVGDFGICRLLVIVVVDAGARRSVGVSVVVRHGVLRLTWLDLVGAPRWWRRRLESEMRSCTYQCDWVSQLKMEEMA